MAAASICGRIAIAPTFEYVWVIGRVVALAGYLDAAEAAVRREGGCWELQPGGTMAEREKRDKRNDKRTCWMGDLPGILRSGRASNRRARQCQCRCQCHVSQGLHVRCATRGH